MRGLSAEPPSLLLRIVSKAMRRWTTVLIVGAVVAVAVFAAADALRGRDEPKAPAASPTITRPKPPTLRDILRREAIAGFALYSDQNCRLHSLLLPRMVDDVVREEGGAEALHCRFGIGGGRILEEGEVMSPDRSSIARCRGRTIAVWDAESGIGRRSIRGCAPAWRPDGRLTYARGEAVYEDRLVLLNRSQLHLAARRHPNVAGLGAGIPFRVRVTDLAWLDEEHLVASLEIRIRNVEFQYAAVLFDGGAIVDVDVRFGQPLRNWVVSDAGSYAASEDGTIVARDGGSIDPPQNLPTGTADAFSPDEQWLAYATGVSIYLIGTPRNSEPGRIIRLPVQAEDLVWEPSGAGAMGTSTAAG
jgi:hypothetical protein